MILYYCLTEFNKSIIGIAVFSQIYNLAYPPYISRYVPKRIVYSVKTRLTRISSWLFHLGVHPIRCFGKNHFPPRKWTYSVLLFPLILEIINRNIDYLLFALFDCFEIGFERRIFIQSIVSIKSNMIALIVRPIPCLIIYYRSARNRTIDVLNTVFHISFMFSFSALEFLRTAFTNKIDFCDCHYYLPFYDIPCSVADKKRFDNPLLHYNSAAAWWEHPAMRYILPVRRDRKCVSNGRAKVNPQTRFESWPPKWVPPALEVATRTTKRR